MTIASEQHLLICSSWSFFGWHRARRTGVGGWCTSSGSGGPGAAARILSNAEKVLQYFSRKKYHFSSYQKSIEGFGATLRSIPSIRHRVQFRQFSMLSSSSSSSSSSSYSCSCSSHDDDDDDDNDGSGGGGGGSSGGGGGQGDTFTIYSAFLQTAFY